MYLEWRDINGALVQHPISPDMEPITIGRNPGSTVYSKETTVSRNHGRIGWDEEGYYIKDLGSSNGTFINNERTRRAVFRDGDTVRCGEVLEILCKAGDLPDPKRRTQALPPEERPRQKPMATGSMRPEDRSRLEAAVAAKQGLQQVVQSQADQVREMAARSGQPLPAGPVPSPLQAPTRRANSGIMAAVEMPPPRDLPINRENSRDSGRDSSREQPAIASSRDPTPAAQPVQLRSSSASPDPELQRKVRQLEQQLAEAESRATRAEKEVKDIEPRAMRYSVELESLTDKYVKLKEHNQLIGQELEKTRSELRQREDQAFEAERKTTELEQQIAAAREKANDATEQLSGLKVRLTQKDRQIEELQRQLDLLEYELRAARDENESLQTSFNREANDQTRLERKINLLQDVIEQKEAQIDQLRVDLREKDIEIRQVRMGVGISDLEHEKRQLLQDYHNAMRRVDELNDRLMQQTRQVDQLKAELDSAKEAAERKPAPLIDVSEHPDFKAKVRELERLREEMSGLQKELARSELKLEHAQQDSGAMKKAEAELNQQHRKVEALEAKLHEAEARVAELVQGESLAAAQTPAAFEVSAAAVEALDALGDAVAASKSNATLVRRYAQQMEKHRAAVPEAEESIELMNDIAIVLAQDLVEQERMVVALKRDLGVP